MSTTIRVSQNTVKKLEILKKKFGVKSLEDVILILINERKRELVEKFFGIDRGRISKFTEEDRFDARI